MPKPVVTNRELIVETRVFRIERVGLRFANGNEVSFERLCGSGRGAVMVVPMQDPRTLILVREYAAGLDRYELMFPKGLMEEGETPEQSACRELKEEVGYGARRLELLKTLSIAPGYTDFQTHIILARDLYPERLPGDEPEQIEAVPWPLAETGALLERDDFVEARSIAALHLLTRYLTDD